jgi:hypothetical protein
MAVRMESLLRLLAPVGDPARTPLAIAPRTTSGGAIGALSHAVRRELTVAGRRVRRGPPAVVHRLPSGTTRDTGLRRAARDVLLGGAVIERDRRGEVRRVLDEVLGAAGATPVGSLRVGTGGGVLLPVDAGGRPAILRVGIVGSAGDPLPTATTLAAIGPLAVVPEALGRGIVEGLQWTTESRLPGRAPRHVTDGLVASVLGVLRALPHDDGPPSSFVDDVDRIAAALPTEAERLVALVTTFDPVLRTLPAIRRHGDLWSGNLLVEGDRLTGLVDWDASHAAAVPGTDAMQLLSGEQRGRRGHTLGSAFLARPWESDRATRVLGPWWAAELGRRPSSDVLVAIAAAWWATEVAGTLARTERAGDDAWLDANVRPVLAFLGL